MAMGLNEICQYPESVGAINSFRKNYESSYRWLNEWKTNRNSPLYPEAVRYIKKSSTTPDRVASEWVRSPIFIADQTEINLLFDEKEATAMLGKAGAKEQRDIGTDLLKILKDLKPRYKAAKAGRKPGEPLPRKVRELLAALKIDLQHYRRMQKAAPVWLLILKSYKKSGPHRQEFLLSEINQELAETSARMLRQLDEIADNLQLIEVEIYNGASQDIIWQNVHPDYRGIASGMKDDRTAPEKVWNWGHVPNAGTDELKAEIWEDELGSFKANLFDNCSARKNTRH